MAEGGNSSLQHQFLETLAVVAFDCDGVIFDSREANVQFYDHILREIGHPLPVQTEQRAYIHMHPVLESLRFLLGDGEAFQKACRYVRTMDIWPFNKHLQKEPGILEVLQLAKSCYHTAMATNRTVSTHEVLAHFQLDIYFDLVVSAADVKRPKPHPDIMERIQEEFRVAPQQILYVGDSAVDEAFAVNTGVFFAAYKNPQLKAHLHISHFNQLHAVLSNDTGNGAGNGQRPRERASGL